MVRQLKFSVDADWATMYFKYSSRDLFMWWRDIIYNQTGYYQSNLTIKDEIEQHMIKLHEKQKTHL